MRKKKTTVKIYIEIPAGKHRSWQGQAQIYGIPLASFIKFLVMLGEEQYKRGTQLPLSLPFTYDEVCDG